MNWRTSVFAGTLLIVVVGGSLAIGLSGGKAVAGDCKGIRSISHKAIIHDDGKVVGGDIQAKPCDTLTITNEDRMVRNIAFGMHDKHISYDGITVRTLSHDQSFTVTLDNPGRFHWHDHLHDEVEGYFTVSK